MIEKFFDNADVLTTALTHAITADLSHQLDISNVASIVVSGGSTPKALYQQLSKSDLDWLNITVTLTDDRWVDNNHPESNERMVKHYLLKNHAKSANFIPLKTSHTTAREAESNLEKTLKQQLPSVDYVVLGMGEDGHFASLFPHTDELTQGMDLNNLSRCLATRSPVEPKERISLTLSMLLSAKKIYLLITGDDKLNVYRRACLTNQIESTSTLPISAVLKQVNVPVEVFWSPTS